MIMKHVRRKFSGCDRNVKFGMIFSAGGYSNTVTSGKQASHYQYNDLCIHLFLHTNYSALGFDPISKHDFLFSELFLFQNPHFVVDDASTSLPLQEAKTVAAVASPSHAPKFGRVDGCRSFPLWRASRFCFGEFHLPRFLGWKVFLFFSAGRFVFCPDSFLIEVVKH